MEVEEGPGPSPLTGTHLIVCRKIQYDPADADAGHSLEGVLACVRPPDGGDFGFDVPRMYLFAQLYGTPGDYKVRIRLIRLGQDENGKIVELEEVAEFGPWGIGLLGTSYVEGYGFALTDVPFPVAGWYEFQLWLVEPNVQLSIERVEARK